MEHDIPSDRAKGAGVELIVSLGASGALAGLAQILHIWLSRDRRRTLTLSIRREGTAKVVHIDGTNVSLDSITNALESATVLGSCSPEEGDSDRTS
jgi:Effector Associated Constant Component 1